MFKRIWKSIYLSSSLLCATVLISSDAVSWAAEPTNVKAVGVETSNSSLDAINLYTQQGNRENDPLGQITNVHQLRDVSTTDWAYSALQSLVERYGCLVGYSDLSYRGNRSLSRYEFAAGLNACLNQIEALIEKSEAILREDLEKLQRLVQEFEEELTRLGTRVDNLEGRIAFLEERQFSPTTKLIGEVIVAAVQVFGEENASTGEDLDEQVTLNQRTRLSLLTSFTGKDRLRTRLQVGNFVTDGPGFRGGSNTTRLNFASNTDDQFILNKIEYRFPIGDRTQFWVTGVNMNLDDVANPLAPYTADSGTGSISAFGSYAPIYYTSSGAGAAFSHNFTKELNLVGFYSSINANGREEGTGLFNGQFVAAGQLTYNPSSNASLGLVYSHNYFPGNLTGFVSGGFGSFAADDPFDGAATSSDNLALVWTWQVASNFNLSGWGMYTQAHGESGARRGDRADIWNWKLTFAFPDLFSQGNLGALTVGNPPRAYNVEGGPEDNETAWLVELFYRFQLNEYISVTPGAFVVTNPEDGRQPLWVGVIRTTFSF